MAVHYYDTSLKPWLFIPILLQSCETKFGIERLYLCGRNIEINTVKYLTRILSYLSLESYF